MKGRFYDVVLYNKTDEEAIEWAKSFAFSDCEKTDDMMGALTLIDSVNGINVFWNQYCDFYVFSDVEKDIDSYVQNVVQQMFRTLGIDNPTNMDDIVDYIQSDIEDTVEGEAGDLDISRAFRRWIEAQTE